MTTSAAVSCHSWQDRAVTNIGGYPHTFYLVGVVVVFAVVGFTGFLVYETGLRGWTAGAIWLASLALGFAAARQVNAWIFRSGEDR